MNQSIIREKDREKDTDREARRERGRQVDRSEPVYHQIERQRDMRQRQG